MKQLGRFVSDRWWLRALVGAALLSLLLILAIVWIQNTGSRTDQRVAVTFLINLVAVIGMQIFMGNSGVISFGHVSFVAIGAYAGAIFLTPAVLKATPVLIPDAPGFLRDSEMGFLPGMAIALVIVGIISIPLGLAIVRLKDGSAAIATLALLIIVQTVIGNWGAITHGPQTWAGVAAHTTVWTALWVAVVAIFAARAFRESGTGFMLRATRGEELATSAIGIHIARARLSAWVLSAVVAGAAGVLWASYFQAISPRDFFFDLTFLFVVMVIVGGTSVSGAVVGAAMVTAITEITRRSETGGIDFLGIKVDQVFGLTPIVLGALVLVVVLVRPQGLLGRWEVDEWLLRAARRLRARGAAPTTGGPAAPELVGAAGAAQEEAAR
jgi:branched-chain amino acid transport system permease protein